MKSFKDMVIESTAIFESVDSAITEGKKRVKKVVKTADGKWKKMITFTCTGDGEKYDRTKRKCIHMGGKEQAQKTRGAKRRARTLKRKPQSVKDREHMQRDKAKVRFGIRVK